MLGVVSGPEHPAVHQPGWRWQFGQDRCRVLLAGIVENPGEELGSFPGRAPGSLGEQETAPLGAGEVAFDQRQRFGNWLYWQAAALAHNVALWLGTLALPREMRRARGKRLRLSFLNIAARLVRHGRRLHLRFAAAYHHADAFRNALRKIRALPAFG